MHPDRKPSVLVVDDEAANLSTFMRVFRGDFVIATAASAQEALETLRRTTFDVALVDYAMPEMNGLEFLQQASLLQPSMARLLLTAHSELPEVRKAAVAGVVAGVISKPWDRAAVTRWVGTIRQMSSMRQTVESLKQAVDGMKQTVPGGEERRSTPPSSGSTKS